MSFAVCILGTYLRASFGEWVFLVLFVALGRIYRKSSFTWSTLVEMIIYVVLRCVVGSSLTFVMFQTSKFALSFLLFWCRYYTGAHDGLTPLFYLSGFRPRDHPDATNSLFHGALLFGNRLVHYRDRRNGDGPGDPMFPLTPDYLTVDETLQVLSRPHGSTENVDIQQFVGYGPSDASVSEDEMRSVLESSGQCYHFAVITIYELSTDKFFSYMIVQFLRYDMWLGVFIGWVVSLFAKEGVDQVTDMLFLLIAVFDAANLRPRKLRDSHERRLESLVAHQGHLQHGVEVVYHLQEVSKLVGLCLCWYVWYHVCAWFALSVISQWIVLWFACLMSCACMQHFTSHPNRLDLYQWGVRIVTLLTGCLR